MCIRDSHRRPSAAINQSETTLTNISEEHSKQPHVEQDGVGVSLDHCESEGEDGGEKSAGDEPHAELHGVGVSLDHSKSEGEGGREKSVGDESVVDGNMSGDGLKESQGEDSIERMSNEENKDSPLIERTADTVKSSGGEPPSLSLSSPEGTQVELAESNNEPSRGHQSSSSEPKEESEDSTELAQNQSDTADDMLAIMGAADPNQDQLSSQNSESSDSVTSLDALLADSPYFLHVCVSSKSLHTYTYTPINSSVGIDIPRTKSAMMEGDVMGSDHIKKPRSLSPPVVHHVKNKFCFAVIDKKCVKFCTIQ